MTVYMWLYEDKDIVVYVYDFFLFSLTILNI